MWDYSTISPFTHWCPLAVHRPFTISPWSLRIIKGLSYPKKLDYEVRGSPTYILGPLPFHKQCGTIQQ
uniref:Uncharacterized protein n=1 Tax=Oryza glumipatula TaxID=40148 RepID=A0A0D9YSU3_9ORYZ